MTSAADCNHPHPRSLSRYNDTMETFMQSGQYSDLRLVCQGHEFLVHRIIVCAHSPVFKTACEGEFLEARTQTITLDADDPESIRHLICYMYTLDYHDHERTSCGDSPEPASSHGDEDLWPQGVWPAPEQEADTSELFSSVRVYAVADKYDVIGLKDLARSRFKAWAQLHWRSEHFPAMISEVFETTPTEDDGLRDIVVSIVAANISSLVWNQALLDVVSEHGHLGLKLLEKVASSAIALEVLLRNKVAALESKMKQLELDKAISNDQLRTLTRRLNDNNRCRHCGVDMNVIVEAGENATPRCRNCRTRHH